MPSKIQERTKRFLRLAFQDYYKAYSNSITVPQKVNMREFAFEDWEFTWRCTKRKEMSSEGHMTEVGCGAKGTSLTRPEKCPFCGAQGITATNWTRHLGFQSVDALVQELISKAPQSVYHSAAFYWVPVARSMQEKKWQGAELVFDIDADHLDAPCTHDHDGWMCANADCRNTGWGKPPEEGCPDCGGIEFLSRKWICDRCLDDAKQNTLKVYDAFITQDFGIDPENIVINFSGHRGYHIRVTDPNVFKIGAGGRVDIVHSIRGVGLDGTKAILTSGGVAQVLPRTVPGWGGRVADAIIEFLRKIDSFEGEYRWTNPLKKKREQIIRGLLRNPPVLVRVQGIGVKSWQEIAEIAVAAYGGKIDEPVTHDVHRVIRLIGSVHGKTGLIVRRLSREAIEEFDPFNDALAFQDGTLKVHVQGGLLEVPRFRIGDELYGPFGDETVELPMAAAMFLLCKGVAVIE